MLGRSCSCTIASEALATAGEWIETGAQVGGAHAAEGLSSRKKNLPSFSPASVSHRSDLTHSTSSPLTLHATDIEAEYQIFYILIITQTALVTTMETAT